MSIKKLNEQALNEWVDKLIADEPQRFFGIQAKNDRFAFDELESSKDLRLDYDVSLQPPKKFFQPPIETLLKFQVKGGYDSVTDDQKFILFGVHPYDMIALNQMTSIFQQDYYDDHYMTRRNNATVVAVDVQNPSENVFAASMGKAVVKEGFDILLTKIAGGDYLAEAATEKGEHLLNQAQTNQASDEDIQKREQIWQENQKKLNKHELDCHYSYLPKLLDNPGVYDHPVFEEKAETCFSCGSCTQVCPTCYCFSVQEDVNWDLQSGERRRFWDGCMLDGFTEVAGGHEFRKNRADRFRHRIYRKGKYVPGKIDGEIACVGCGRCVSACLPDIANPVNVYNRLIEDFGIK